MKTKITRAGRRAVSIVITLMLIVSTMLIGAISVNASVSNYKMSAGDILYYDFTKLPTTNGTGVNCNKGTGVTSVYDANGIGNVVSVTLSAEMDFSNSNLELYKTQYGGWDDNVVKSTVLPQDGQNMIVVNADEKTYTWGTYGESGGDTSKTYYIRASEWNSWDAGSAQTMQISTDGTYAYYQNTGSLEFKVCEDLTWTTSYGKDNIGDKNTYNTNITVDVSGNNCKISESGKYYIIFFIEDKKICASTTLPGSSEPTPTPGANTYYINGRFRTFAEDGTTVAKSIGWVDGSTSDIQFTYDASSECYRLDTNATIKQLAEKIDQGGNDLQYFFIYNGTSKFRYGSDLSLTLTDQNQKKTISSSNSGGSFYFTDTDESGKVTLWIDDTNVSSGSLDLWYTLDSGSSTAGAHKITGSATNGTLTFKAEGKTAGTADAGDTVTITASPSKGYKLKDGSLKATYTDGTTTTELTITDNQFTMPDYDVTVKAEFELDKESFVSGTNKLWLDVNPDSNATSATLISWNNYKGSSHATDNPYTFYVPNKVDLTTATIYNGYSASVTINGTTINGGSSATVNLTKDGNNTVSGATSGTDGKFTVMQGSTDAMFLYTTDTNGNAYNLPTKTDSSLTTKSTVSTKGGYCVTMDNSSTNAKFSSAMALDSVKGRGNSSWEASYKLFGKYAYNMKLKKATNLLGMDTAGESSGSKSWCLLANNADESMLRNALTYQLADDVGLYYSPEFRFVDIYDNGEYMGSYLVTEKVDVGSSKLIKGESLEDINKGAGVVFDEDTKPDSKSYNYQFEVNGTSYTKSITYRYSNLASNSTITSQEYLPTNINDATYLLEFEIDKRYMDEPCWFTTPRGQHVVIKTPEFATEAEVKYIAEKFVEMETAVFTDNASNSLLGQYIDLDSFAKMYLIQELSSNLDAASTSYYVMFNGNDDIFTASPVWDYDWAYGQYASSAKKDINGNGLSANNPTIWFAKNKSYDDSEGAQQSKYDYSIQSKLANNTDFQKVIKKVWNGTDTEDGFYDKVQAYYGTDSQLDQWLSYASASFTMNETRWNFLSTELISGWGSNDTGDTFEATVGYLENSWLAVRAPWLNNSAQINSYGTYTQFAKPTLSALDSTGTAITETANGTEITLKADTTETFVTYTFYDGETVLSSGGTSAEYTFTPDAGEHTYKVETVYGADNTMTSDTIKVTVTGEVTPSLNGVSISGSTGAITSGSLTFTATPSYTGEVTGITYSLYTNTSAAIDGATLVKGPQTSNTFTVTAPDTVDKYYYYVTATYGGTTVTSEIKEVNVTTSVHPVTIYFKAPSAYAYQPTVTLDGTTTVAMSSDGAVNLGKIYSGSLEIIWWKAEIAELDSSKTHTLNFTARSTDLNASITGDFSATEIYIGVDNLVSGTTAVDLTGELEHIRNFYYTPTHMVNCETENGTILGFTYYEGKRYRMGTALDLSIETVSINSATAIQTMIAYSTPVSDVQYALYDTNLDGKVDVNDATVIQIALANGI